MQAGIRILGAVLIALCLSGCSEDEDTEEDFCKGLGESRVHSRMCKCYVRAVTREIDSKAEDFMLNAIGDMSREERDRVRRTMRTITEQQVERIHERLVDCREDE